MAKFEHAMGVPGAEDPARLDKGIAQWKIDHEARVLTACIRESSPAWNVMKTERDAAVAAAEAARVATYSKAREEGRVEGATETQTEIGRLRAALNSDRTGLAAGLVAILDRCKAASWIEDGRGCYEWDDERYKEEAGRALRGVVEIATLALRDSGALVDRTFNGPLDDAVRASKKEDPNATE